MKNLLRVWALCASFLGVVSVGACVNPCASPTVPTSAVTVLDDATSMPVPDATVTLRGQGSNRVTFTGANGSSANGTYMFTGSLPDGEILTLEVDATGYNTLIRGVAQSELTMPTGCGLALSLTVRIRKL